MIMELWAFLLLPRSSSKVDVNSDIVGPLGDDKDAEKRMIYQDFSLRLDG